MRYPQTASFGKFLVTVTSLQHVGTRTFHSFTLSVIAELVTHSGSDEEEMT